MTQEAVFVNHADDVHPDTIRIDIVDIVTQGGEEAGSGFVLVFFLLL
jgi:hypothetical protein